MHLPLPQCGGYQTQDIIEEGFVGLKYVCLLQWVLTTYPGPELMGSQALGLEKNLILPLSTDAAVGNLIGSYLANMRDNYIRQGLRRGLWGVL